MTPFKTDKREFTLNNNLILEVRDRVSELSNRDIGTI